MRTCWAPTCNMQLGQLAETSDLKFALCGAEPSGFQSSLIICAALQLDVLNPKLQGEFFEMIRTHEKTPKWSPRPFLSPGVILILGVVQPPGPKIPTV